MKNLIVPCCGRNFLNGMPKFLNIHPDGQLLALKSISQLELANFDNLYYVILQEDIEHFDALSKLNLELKDCEINVQIVVLKNRTDGPAETIYRAIKEENISGQIVIKDLDNMFSFTESCEGNFIIGLNLIEYNKDIYNLRKKSFLVINEQNIVLDIVEKRLCSDVISAGLYGFDNADDFVFAYERLMDENYGIQNCYVSHVISYLIGYGQKKFIYVDAIGYESWGSEKEWDEIIVSYGKDNKNGMIIVDLDGTLIDTNAVNYYAYKKALNEDGADVEKRYFYQHCNGYSYKVFLPKLIENNSEAAMERIHEKKLLYYSDYLHKAKVNTVLVQMLQGVSKQKNIVLVTTASKKNTYEILRYYGLEPLFDRIYTSEDVKKVKPDPEGFLKAIKDFGVSKEEVVVFEDSDVGVKAAYDAGLICYKVCDVQCDFC